MSNLGISYEKKCRVASRAFDLQALRLGGASLIVLALAIVQDLSDLRVVPEARFLRASLRTLLF